MIVSCVLWSQNAWYHLLAYDMFSFFLWTMQCAYCRKFLVTEYQQGGTVPRWPSNSFFFLEFSPSKCWLGIPFWLVFFNFSLIQPPPTASHSLENASVFPGPGPCQLPNLPRDIPKRQLTDKIASLPSRFHGPSNLPGCSLENHPFSGASS